MNKFEFNLFSEFTEIDQLVNLKIFQWFIRMNCGFAKNMFRHPITLICIFSIPLLVAVLCFSCSSPEKSGIEIQWKNDRATGIILRNFTGEKEAIQVRLARDSAAAIFGSSRIENGDLVFEPLAPFTRGLEYAVNLENMEIGRISIPPGTAIPELIGIYPNDTVPENLLKIHLEFSRPMREGQSLTHITWLDDQGDTLKNILLYLKTELWNPDRTLLTLWLDPGRIKRGLQPNQSLGTPLQKGKRYLIKIDSMWEDETGMRLAKSYSAKLWVTGRDSLSPMPTNWKVSRPEKNTNKPLVINFMEDLDYSLIADCFSLYDRQGKPVPGLMQLDIRNRKLRFIPQDEWRDNAYSIRVESRLEDVAGNNLNRPFDRNIKSHSRPEKAVYQIEIESIK
jgi:Bacterial Ig-like domain